MTHYRLHRALLSAVALSAVGALLASPQLAQAAAAPAAPAPASGVRVIVQGAGAGDAVRSVGGAVELDLPLVHGVAATVPASQVARLTSRGLAVSENDQVAPLEYAESENASTVSAVHRRETRTLDLHGQGVTGKGVTIALVDTGVSTTGTGGELPDALLVTPPHRAGSPVAADQRCLNLSDESDCLDRYGHGTALAGLIAGTGAASGGSYAGHAPGARLLSIKLAGRSGAADVSKVLAAIQYVVSYRHGADGRPGGGDDIEVLNLSLGTPSRQSWALSPLNLAVQRAWVAGVTVVVASGNLGKGEVSKPGDDPLVVTVGALDDRQTGSYNDDRVPNFSGRATVDWGPRPLAKPDVVVPGARLPLVVPKGSTVDGVSPLSRMYGTYRQGSGTSMSTAIVSGISALVIEARRAEWAALRSQRPEVLTSDLVKLALTSTARPDVGTQNPADVGKGLVDAFGAAGKPLPVPGSPSMVLSDGSGPIEGDRGRVAADGTVLRVTTHSCVTGNRTAQGVRGAAGDPSAPCGSSGDTSNSYYGLQYSGTVWSPTSWTSSQWVRNPEMLGSMPSSLEEAQEWQGNQWQGNQWQTSEWLGNQWQGNQWQGNQWQTGADDSTGYGIPAPGGAWLGAWR